MSISYTPYDFVVYSGLEYKFEGTPLRIRVGYDLWRQDQAGYIGDNDPRFAVFGDFGDFDECIPLI